MMMGCDTLLVGRQFVSLCGIPAHYKNSRPVLRGNRAAKQKQLGATGFFADCIRTYLDHGGERRDEFWQLLKRRGDYTAKKLAGQRRWHLGTT